MAKTESVLREMAVDPRLQKHRSVWERKPVLRTLYADYHRRMLEAIPGGGLILDIGAGSGHFKELRENIVSLDILSAPWVDVVSDASALPFSDQSVAGIAMLDVLHHLARPMTFFHEAARVLMPGGRLVMIEPGITPLSWIFYNFLHQEDVDLSVDPMSDQSGEIAADPFASNQALPTLLFAREKHRARFLAAESRFSLLECRWLSLFAYPLSGGFKPWSLLPASLARPMLSMEATLLPVLGPLMAFRLAVVLQRS